MPECVEVYVTSPRPPVQGSHGKVCTLAPVAEQLIFVGSHTALLCNRGHLHAPGNPLVVYMSLTF